MLFEGAEAKPKRETHAYSILFFQIILSRSSDRAAAFILAPFGTRAITRTRVFQPARCGRSMIASAIFVGGAKLCAQGMGLERQGRHNHLGKMLACLLICLSLNLTRVIYLSHISLLFPCVYFRTLSTVNLTCALTFSKFNGPIIDNYPRRSPSL